MKAVFLFSFAVQLAALVAYQKRTLSTYPREHPCSIRQVLKLFQPKQSLVRHANIVKI